MRQPHQTVGYISSQSSFVVQDYCTSEGNARVAATGEMRDHWSVAMLFFVTEWPITGQSYFYVGLLEQ